MDAMRLSKTMRALGGIVHFFGVLAGASAVHNVWTQVGSLIRHRAPVGWGDLLYRVGLCVVFVSAGLALGRFADRTMAGGDAERERAALAEREEADRLTRQIVVPRRRTNRAPSERRNDK